MHACLSIDMNVINVSMTACILTFNECMDFCVHRHECPWYTV